MVKLFTTTSVEMSATFQKLVWRQKKFGMVDFDESSKKIVKRRFRQFFFNRVGSLNDAGTDSTKNL